ncbi:hypothetical protein HJD18_12155 [Thermoleophilia bacterium SCSIO 60948]|nr:hypothetical protein HJD18_12155 [Thermoleophilia bacterium SCSIO 60948]
MTDSDKRTETDEPADPDAAAKQAEGINPADGPGPYGNPDVDTEKLEKVEDEIDSVGPN